MKPIRVIIVEDSPMMRSYLANAIGRAPGFEVVATAHNAADALDKIESEGPDLVTLDVELPDMNGIELLKRIMETRAPAVVMVSGLTQSGAQTTLRALQLGAVDFVGKLDAKASGDREIWTQELIEKLRRAATVRPHRLGQQSPECAQKPVAPADAALPWPASPVGSASSLTSHPTRAFRKKLIVIGANSAATDSLNRLLIRLPGDCPPVIVALQLSPVVIEALVSMLKRKATAEIKIATDGDVLKQGWVYLGPGDSHVGLATVTKERCVRLKPGDPIRGHLPSIDLLFEAAAQLVGADAIGILLDTAGDDGETGLRQLAAKNARVMRQTRDMRKAIDRQTTAGGRSIEIPVLPMEQIVESLFG